MQIYVLRDPRLMQSDGHSRDRLAKFTRCGARPARCRGVASAPVKAIHTFTVSPRLPDSLAPLRELAMNLGWIADERVQDLFRRVDAERWEYDGIDALGFLVAVPKERLDALGADPSFVAAVTEVRDDLRRALESPRWFQTLPQTDLGLVAYFSPEFGIAEALPQYSGGLGILAGDHLKAASDLGVPLVGIGLFYHHGYFRQSLDRFGWQQERLPRLHPREMALAPVPGVGVVVDLAGVPVHLGIWKATVGRVELYLLDTDVEENDEAHRGITDRLYGGDTEQRLRQELVLGIGGIRALDALGLSPQVLHMNEGHAGFLALERIRTLIRDRGLSFDEAIEATRPAQVFTTHTPVPAGIDRFPRDLVERYFGGWASDCGVSIDVLMGLGHEPGTEPGAVLNLAAMSLRLSGSANGVSRLHRDVSRKMFADLWPGLPLEDVPIGSVTNGVHARSWVSREMGDLLDRHLGSDWADATADRWVGLEHVSDDELWALRATNRERLVEFARRWTRDAELARGASEGEAAWCDDILDPHALTIGFARRFAPYKRATLLLREPESLRALLRSDDRPVQFVFAGKAHPADEPGKQLLQVIARTAADLEIRHRFVFLEDFGIGVGRMLYRGVDVWLNNPRRPMEACGTSGMKAALNAGLNCSILDGWWDEWYDGENGWALPSAEWIGDVEERDRVEAAGLLSVLANDVIPAFYERGAGGLPHEWLRRVRASLCGLGPRVGATRMVREYVTDWYLPAAARRRMVTVDDHALARALVGWRDRIGREWPNVAVTRVVHEEVPTAPGEGRRCWADVTLAGLDPSEVEVQLLYGSVELDDELRDPQRTRMEPEHAEPDEQGSWRYVATMTCEHAGTYGFAVRVVPSYPGLGADVTSHPVVWAPRVVGCVS